MKNQKKYRAHRVVLYLLATLVVLHGCQSSLTGNEGNLLFSYTADDDFEDFNKPLAVGAKLEVRVLQSGTRTPVELTDVRSTDDSVLIVDSVAGNRIVLMGAGEGSSLIEVEAQLPGGDTVTDSVNMLASEPDRLVLRHTCAAEGMDEVKYLAASTDVWLAYDLELQDGQAVIGYGLHPVQFDPADLITLNRSSTDQAHLHLDLPAEPAEVTVSSTIDDEQATISVVDPGAIDGAEMNPLSQELTIATNSAPLLHFWPTVQGARVCQAQTPLSAESLTPEVCTVNEVDEDVIDLLNQFNSIQLEAHTAGTCEFEVTFESGNDGQGVTIAFTRDIVGSQNQ